AKRSPLVKDGRSPAAAAPSARVDTRESRSSPNVRVWRTAATIPIPTIVTATASAPAAATVQSTWSPTLGSARRATPTGNSGDRANAPATASGAPTIAITVVEAVAAAM